MQLFGYVLDHSIDAKLCGISRHIGVRRYLNQVHFSYRHFSSCSMCTVWSKTCSKLLIVKNCSSEIDSFDKIFLDEKNRGPRLLIALCLICNSLIRIWHTFNLTSGGVNVKIPSLGMLTPLPIRRFRFMYNPRAFQIILISSSLKLPSIL
jgi:hypothetical protein